MKQIPFHTIDLRAAVEKPIESEDDLRRVYQVGMGDDDMGETPAEWRDWLRARFDGAMHAGIEPHTTLAFAASNGPMALKQFHIAVAPWTSDKERGAMLKFMRDMVMGLKPTGWVTGSIAWVSKYTHEEYQASMAKEERPRPSQRKDRQEVAIFHTRDHGKDEIQLWSIVDKDGKRVLGDDVTRSIFGGSLPDAAVGALVDLDGGPTVN